ncbi:MAG TPA: NAD(P)H-binding protein [Gaiellaceae bacterium]|nr:NAD(P)H-binding protein [Gaiellaceae bacterium]
MARTREAQTVLVLGGTGKTGTRVASRLAARGVPVRIGSRSAERPFHWEREETWAAAVEGAGAAYVSFHPDLAVPGAVEAVRAFAGLAVDAGVRRLVLLSGRGEEEAERAEQAVREAGAEWTIVRCAWFSQNFSESYLLEPVRLGEVVLPAGDVGEPFVDAEDIADVAAAALVEDGHAGELYELTGPRLLTFAEAVAELSGATGREIRYVPVGLSEYAAALAEEGVAAEYVALLTYLFREVLDGRNAFVADGVRRALGRQPRDFGEYVRTTAATGAWELAPASRAA